MAEEKIITVNLRKELTKVPRWTKANRTVKILREILEKQTETENLKIDSALNERIWSRSSKNPPAKFRIKIVKVDDKTSRAELMEK
jgi:large subunit ribosomal protein L31e